MALRESQSRFAANGGVRLHYTVAGAGHTLLLLHGIPDCCSGWQPQIDALSGRYRVAAMDLRGVNYSDQPRDAGSYRIAELVTDVAAVIRELGDNPITLIGHDWGAILGWWTAALDPGQVSRLAVLSSPHPLCYLAARERGELIYPRGYMEQIVAAVPAAPFDVAALSAWVSDPAARGELARALGRSDPEAMRNYYRVNVPPRGALHRGAPKISVPTLIMYGADDDFIPQRYYDESRKYVAAQCNLVAIPHAGHFIHREAAAAVTAELLKWLDETA
jgi:epoxide hydrolase 4